jgi:cell wall-associated NlpC family hydrolase
MADEMAQRAAVVAAARSWLGTPFKHAAAAKGSGIDCAHLLLESYVEAGLVERFDPDFYPADWHMHRNEERFLEAIERYAQRLDDSEAPIAERGPDFHVLPGNVLIWKHGRTFSHGAIVSLWPMIIHASAPARCCLEESVMGHETEFKACRVYSVWGS